MLTHTTMSLQPPCGNRFLYCFSETLFFGLKVLRIHTSHSLWSNFCFLGAGAPVHDPLSCPSNNEQTRPRYTVEGSRTRTPVPRSWAWTHEFPEACGESKWPTIHRRQSKGCKRAAAFAEDPVRAKRNMLERRRRRSCRPR